MPSVNIDFGVVNALAKLKFTLWTTEIHYFRTKARGIFTNIVQNLLGYSFLRCSLTFYVSALSLNQVYSVSDETLIKYQQTSRNTCRGTGGYN